MKAKVSPKDNKKDLLRKTARTKYSPEQVCSLERLFISCQYPDTEVMQDISEQLAVSIEKISIWFQNRRAKFKRTSKNTHSAWMRQQVFSQDNIIRPSTKMEPEVKKHILTPPEPATKYSPDHPSSNLQYSSIPNISPYLPSFGPEFYAYQQYAFQEFYRNASEPAYNMKPLSINDFAHDLSQNQFNTSHINTASNQSTNPVNCAGSYAPVYYPYSAQHPYGPFPPVGV